MQENKLHLEEILMETSKIIPYQNNAKIHTGEQISLLASHIAESGWDQPIVVDKDMVIIKGHGRLMAAMKLGLKRVPVKIRSDLTPNQVKAARIADNKISDIGGYDEELLKVELEGLHEIDVNLADIGIDDETISSLGLDDDDKSEHDSEKEDDIPEVEQNIYGVKRGDIWLLGKHRVMCGDSTDKADVDRLMDGSKADMVFTSPPYNQNNNSFKPGLDSSVSPRRKLYKNFKDSFTPEEFIRFLHSSLDNRSEYVSIININYCANDRASFVKLASDGLGSQSLAETFCWKKSQSMPTPGTIQRIWEPVFIFSEDRLDTLQEREALWTNYIEVSNQKTSEHGHSASFPVLLPETFLNMFKYKSAYDPFLGSGTTLIACEKTNRQAFGLEIDPHYCSVIIQRYIDYVGDSSKVLLSTDKGGKTIEEVLEMRKEKEP